VLGEIFICYIVSLLWILTVATTIMRLTWTWRETRKGKKRTSRPSTDHRRVHSRQLLGLEMDNLLNSAERDATAETRASLPGTCKTGVWIPTTR
jgi:hypothetical protein